jgi:hypothetical protein
VVITGLRNMRLVLEECGYVKKPRLGHSFGERNGYYAFGRDAEIPVSLNTQRIGTK